MAQGALRVSRFGAGRAPSTPPPPPVGRGQRGQQPAAPRGGMPPRRRPNSRAAPLPSSYTPALFFGLGFGTSVKNELAAGLITDCSSPRLNAAQQAECLACVAQRTRHGCLAQTARVTNTVGAHLVGHSAAGTPAAAAAAAHGDPYGAHAWRPAGATPCTQTRRVARGSTLAARSSSAAHWASQARAPTLLRVRTTCSVRWRRGAGACAQLSCLLSLRQPRAGRCPQACHAAAPCVLLRPCRRSP